MSTRSISIQLDEETYKIAERLARITKQSIPEMIKDMIAKKNPGTERRISDSVKKISGILKTDRDYKSLRDMIIDEKIEKYEGIH
jgi:hypothetical protein